jgi:hypothetical protein
MPKISPEVLTTRQHNIDALLADYRDVIAEARKGYVQTLCDLYNQTYEPHITAHMMRHGITHCRREHNIVKQYVPNKHHNSTRKTADSETDP